ncbi:MAG: ergothioneine biosynthesis protein EgtB [Thermodesulfobacteriota bacterium]
MNTKKNITKIEEKDQCETINTSLAKRYQIVREFTETLCKPLATEDYVIQSMPDVSPTKWHLAHTSWFFETFILNKVNKQYRSLHPQYNYLFNSYYVQVGKRHSRPERGLLSRPTVEEVYSYRHYVDQHMLEFLEKANQAHMEEIAPVIEIGLNHEQQHQELTLTDIKHVLSVNPLHPVYLHIKHDSPRTFTIPEMRWVQFPEGVYWIGHDGNGFAFDNESPRHKVYLNSFKLAYRLVTNREYLAFMEDGGYERPELWLSDGWYTVEANSWKAPLYWEKQNNSWCYFTLSGIREVDLDEPVTHVSYYEADAYARWKGVRLPSESEWEIASSKLPIGGNFVESGNFHPHALNQVSSSSGLLQMFGDVWEWTQSPYIPYPGFKTLPGVLGEYNGKFMSNQMVLRGGSCATSISHIRKTYRNFFPPNARWQFMGIRLAKDE